MDTLQETRPWEAMRFPPRFVAGAEIVDTTPGRLPNMGKAALDAWLKSLMDPTQR